MAPLLPRGAISASTPATARLASSLPLGLMPTTPPTPSGAGEEALSLIGESGEAEAVAPVLGVAVHVAELDHREEGVAMLPDSSTLSRAIRARPLPLQRPLKATSSQVSFLHLDLYWKLGMGNFSPPAQLC